MEEYYKVNLIILGMLLVATLAALFLVQQGLNSMHNNRMAEEEILAQHMSTEAYDAWVLSQNVQEEKLAEVQNMVEKED